MPGFAALASKGKKASSVRHYVSSQRSDETKA